MLKHYGGTFALFLLSVLIVLGFSGALFAGYMFGFLLQIAHNAILIIILILLVLCIYSLQGFQEIYKIKILGFENNIHYFCLIYVDLIIIFALLYFLAANSPIDLFYSYEEKQEHQTLDTYYYLQRSSPVKIG